MAVVNWKKETIRWRNAFHALEDDYGRGKVRKKAEKPAKKRVVKKKAKKAVKNVKKSLQGSFDFI